jgi:hypothetical protein
MPNESTPVLTQGSKRRAVGRDHETPSDGRVLATCRYKVTSGAATLQILYHGLRGWELRLDSFQSRHSNALLNFRPGRFATGKTRYYSSPLFLRAKYCPPILSSIVSGLSNSHSVSLAAVSCLHSLHRSKKPNWTAATLDTKGSVCFAGGAAPPMSSGKTCR